MNRGGCFGFFLGSVTGLLIIGLMLWLMAMPLAAPTVTETPAIPPDVTVFVSAQSLSRLASTAQKRPVVIEFDSAGQMQVSARTQLAGYTPVIHVGIGLQMQGANVVSELRWVKLGVLVIPASWLPADVRDIAATIGDTIKAQIPSGFTLVGLTTTPTGINFQLKWTGR